MFGPLGGLPIESRLLVALYLGALENSKVVPNATCEARPYGSRKPQSHKVPGTLAGRSRCIEDWQGLGKILPSPCNRGAPGGPFS